MLLLADENIPRASIDSLRAAGHEVLTADSGAGDEAVLSRAVDQRAVLVTFDRGDFGALVFRLEHRPPLALAEPAPLGGSMRCWSVRRQ